MNTELRKLDAEIHYKLFGKEAGLYHGRESQYDNWYEYTEEDGERRLSAAIVPSYSSTWNDAQLIVEELRKRFGLSIHTGSKEFVITIWDKNSQITWSCGPEFPRTLAEVTLKLIQTSAFQRRNVDGDQKGQV